MSCLITNGRAEACKSNVGGIDAIYFVNKGTFDPETDVTYDGTNTDVIDVIANVSQLFKFELKGVNSFDQPAQVNKDNKTTYFEQTLVLQLAKQDASMHKQFKLLAYGNPHVVVRNRANQFFMMGLERGVDMTAGSIVNGTQMADFNGYNITLTAMEKVPANFLDCTNETDLATTVFDGATIVTA